jgi:class 3 adenylate cyclase/tetratricopeptide (TPR) repeat protein
LHHPQRILNMMTCPKCRFENPTGMKFCGNCGAQLPQAAREGGERRRVTILFADVSGFTSMSEKLDPEEIYLLMNRCYERMGQVLEQHGGTIDKFIGDCIMALFGAPVAHENDPERAVRASLAMQEELRRFNRELQDDSEPAVQMRIGINMGAVIAGAMGSDQQRQYTVMGDAVNVASRLQTLAEPGGILVAASVQEQTCRQFKYKEHGAVQLKGKEKPVTVYELIEPFESAPTPTTSALVGRGHEISQLTGTLERLLQGEGNIIHITGDLGMGKSRLLSELAILARKWGVRCLQTGCHVGENHISYQVVRSLLMQLCDLMPGVPAKELRKRLEERLNEYETELDELTPFLYATLGVPVTLSIEGETAQRMAARAVARFLQSASRSTPLICLLDDLQWIDLPSRDAIAELNSHLQTMPMLMVCAFRPDECQPPWKPDKEIPLRPLTPNQIIELALGLLPSGKLPQRILDKIVERAGGNPFFAEEIVRGLVEVGALTETDGRWQLARDPLETELPAAVESAVTSRIDRLPPDARRVLQVASVVGHHFSVPLLKHVASMDEPLTPVLLSLESAAFLQSQETAGSLGYAFRQPLVREVAYHMLLQAKRRAYHEATAQGLETLFAGRLEDFYEQIAYHYAHSDNREKAIEYLIKAGRKAMSLFDTEEARACFESALREMEMLPPDEREQRAEEHLGCLEAAGDVSGLFGEYDRAMAYYEDALQKLTPEGECCNMESCECRRATLMRKIGTVFVSQARFAEASDWLEHAKQEAMAGTGPDSDRELAKIWAALAVVALRQGHYSKAAEDALKGRQLAEQVAGGTKEMGDCCLVQGVVQHYQGLREEAETNLRKSLRIREETGDLAGIASALNNLGNLLQDSRRFEDADEMYRRSYELREKMGHKEGMSAALINRANIAYHLGRLDEAKQQYEHAIAIAVEIGNHYVANGGRISAAHTQLKMGHIEGSQAMLKEARYETERLGMQDMLCLAEALTAEATLASGNMEAARQAAERALVLAEQIESKFHLAAAIRSQALVLAASGNPETGAQKLNRAIVLFEDAGFESEATEAREQLARLSQPS